MAKVGQNSCVSAYLCTCNCELNNLVNCRQARQGKANKIHCGNHGSHCHNGCTPPKDATHAIIGKGDKSHRGPKECTCRCVDCKPRRSGPIPHGCGSNNCNQ